MASREKKAVVLLAMFFTGPSVPAIIWDIDWSRYPRFAYIGPIGIVDGILFWVFDWFLLLFLVIAPIIRNSRK